MEPVLEDMFIVKLLARCKEAGYTRMGLSRCSIVGEPKGTKDKSDDFWYSGSPAVWRIMRELGVHGGCGNSDQCQVAWGKVSLNGSHLVGIYTLDKKGVWHKEDKEPGHFNIDTPITDTYR